MKKTTKKKTIPTTSKYVVLTIKEVAEFFHNSEGAVRKWIKKGMPVEKNGRYDIKKIRVWKESKEEKNKAEQEDPNSEWSQLYRKNKALMEEMKRKEKEGELISREQVKKSFINMTLAIKSAFLNMPRTISPQLEGLGAREIESILTGKMKEAITLFSSERIFKDHPHASNKGKEGQDREADNLG